MAKDNYPLKQVLEIKKRRVEDAERVVQEKVKELEREQELLAKAEAQRDKAKTHKAEKLQQLRDEMDHSTTSPKIQQMKDYLKVAEERLKVEEVKVQEQKGKVEQAKANLEEARRQLFLRRQEVDKLETHRKDWMKERRKEQEIQEEKEMDEMGNVIYTIHRKRSKSEES